MRGFSRNGFSLPHYMCLNFAGFRCSLFLLNPKPKVAKSRWASDSSIEKETREPHKSRPSSTWRRNSLQLTPALHGGTFRTDKCLTFVLSLSLRLEASNCLIRNELSNFERLLRTHLTFIQSNSHFGEFGWNSDELHIMLWLLLLLQYEKANESPSTARAPWNENIVYDFEEMTCCNTECSQRYAVCTLILIKINVTGIDKATANVGQLNYSEVAKKIVYSPFNRVPKKS